MGGRDFHNLSFRCASKRYLPRHCEICLALKLAEHGIRVNVICPGAIETEIGENTEQRNLEEIKEPVEFPEGKIPLTDGKPGTSEQVAQLVLFLVSDASSHITGTEMWIDGGESLLKG